MVEEPTGIWTAYADFYERLCLQHNGDGMIQFV